MNKTFDKQNQIKKIAQEQGLTYVALFGSYAREEHTCESDINILVDYDSALGLFKFAKVKRLLSNVFGREVDLVSKQGLNSLVRPFVERDLKVLYEI